MKENYFKNLTGNIVKEKTLDEQSKELKKILKKWKIFKQKSIKIQDTQIILWAAIIKTY